MEGFVFVFFFSLPLHPPVQLHERGEEGLPRAELVVRVTYIRTKYLLRPHELERDDHSYPPPPPSPGVIEAHKKPTTAI